MLFVAIGAVGWLTIARIVRGQTLELSAREFVEAARAIGVGHAADPRAPHRAESERHRASCTRRSPIPQMILFESFLSFLGLGVQEPLRESRQSDQ